MLVCNVIGVTSRTVLRHSLTVFDYTVMENKGDKSVTQKTIRDRKSRCVKAVKSALHAGSSDLYEQHTLAWHQVCLQVIIWAVFKQLWLECWPS